MKPIRHIGIIGYPRFNFSLIGSPIVFMSVKKLLPMALVFYYKLIITMTSVHDVYTAPTATAARNICHTLPLTAHGHCPAKNEPANSDRLFVKHNQ